MNALFSLVLLATTPAQTPPPILRASEPSVDKGEVMSGPQLSHTFELTHNGSAGVVALVGFEGSCGCLKAEAVPRILNPGQSAKVTLTVNTLTQPEGPVNWTAVVKYRVDGGPPLDLPVKITAKLVRDVAVTPPMFSISTTGATQQVLTVTDRRATPLTITKAAISNPAFKVEVKAVEAQPTRKQDVVLSVLAELPVGSHEDTLTLFTTDPNYPELRIPVKVLKRAPGGITATPDALAIRINPKQVETSAAVLLRADGKPLAIQKVECAKAGISVRHSEGSNPVATVRAVVNPSVVGAAGATEIVVTLAEPPGKTIIIPISWYTP